MPPEVQLVLMLEGWLFLLTVNRPTRVLIEGGRPIAVKSPIVFKAALRTIDECNVRLRHD